MNNDLKETNPVGTFITSIVGRYNMKSDLVEIANAGHQPALLKIKKEFKEFKAKAHAKRTEKYNKFSLIKKYWFSCKVTP